jgi:hypothetical protein
MTKEASYFIGLMVVVYIEPFSALADYRAPTDSTAPALLLEHGVVFL